MKAYVLDGSPAEIAEMLKALGIKGETAISEAPVRPSDDKEEEAEEHHEWQALPTNVGRKMLTRRPLAAKPKEAILAIYKAGAKGILGSELCELLDYDQAQFRGMMGALGRRMTHTDGWEEGLHFFEYDWNAEEGYRYKLPDASRAAVEAELLNKKSAGGSNG